MKVTKFYYYLPLLELSADHRSSGLNVEQRKRLTIAVELAAKPQLLLFLDEPTSGLDSQTAWSICSLMRKLANSGQAILCTIHQPSAILFQEFDRLLFLAPGGRTVYFGEIGENSRTLTNYFESNGAHACPPHANPAEWMLEVIGSVPGIPAVHDWALVWNQSPERQAVRKELARMQRQLSSKVDAASNVKSSSFAAPFLLQFWLVYKRVNEQYWRTPTYIWSKMILSTFTVSHPCSYSLRYTFLQCPSLDRHFLLVSRSSKQRIPCKACRTRCSQCSC